MVRNYGWEPGRRYVSEVRGINSRLDEIQAAILRVRLRHLDAANAARGRLAAMYDSALAGIDVLRAEVQLASEKQRVTATANDAEKAKLQHKQSETIVNLVFDMMINALKNNDRIEIRITGVDDETFG